VRSCVRASSYQSSSYSAPVQASIQSSTYPNMLQATYQPSSPMMMGASLQPTFNAPPPMSSGPPPEPSYFDNFVSSIFGSSAPSQPQAQGQAQPQAQPPAQPVQTPVKTPVKTPVQLPKISLSLDSIKTQMVSSQQFDGCWDETAIRAILGNSTQAALDANTNSNPKLWLTALGIAILELKCQSLKSNWDIVANKAKTFMSKFLLTQEKMEKDKIAPFVNQLIDKAQEVLRNLNI